MINYYTLIDLPVTATYKQIKSKCKELRLKLESEILLGVNVPALQSQLELIVKGQILLLDADERLEYNEQLAATPKTSIIDPFAPKYFNYADIRTSDIDDWKVVTGYQGDLNIDIFRNLLEQAIKLPYPDIQSNILLSAILTPSALANMLPIVFAFGKSGSGKSQISNLVTKIWGGKPAIGTTSFSTLRRMIGSISTINEGGTIIDLNNALAWDDLSPELLRNEHTFSLFKSACNRATSIYRMPKSQTDTEMLEIQCFGQRYFSSIHPFFNMSEFVELNRRLIIIECHKSDNAEGTIDFESINWEGLPRCINHFWEIHSREYASTRKEIVSYGKKNKVLLPERQALCTDLLTAGMVFKVWDNLPIAYSALKAFFTHTDEMVSNYQTQLKSVLLKILGTTVSNQFAANLLKDAVDRAVKHGLIDQRINKGAITTTMRSIGWELDIDAGMWVKSL